MKLAKLVSLIGVLAMTAVLIFGFTQGDFFVDGGEILSNPWGIVSMVDLYVGFVLFSMWIVFREKNWMTAFIWMVLMMVLGFFTGALYVFINLIRSKGNMNRFFYGYRDHA
jgi:hypothetical protein